MYFLVEQWKLFSTLCDKNYPIFKIWGLFEFGVFIRHPDDLEVNKEISGKIYFSTDITI